MLRTSFESVLWCLVAIVSEHLPFRRLDVELELLRQLHSELSYCAGHIRAHNLDRSIHQTDRNFHQLANLKAVQACVSLVQAQSCEVWDVAHPHSLKLERGRSKLAVAMPLDTTEIYQCGPAVTGELDSYLNIEEIDMYEYSASEISNNHS